MRAHRGPVLSVLLTAVLLLVGAASAAAQQGTVSGTVTDAGSGQPLPQVQVQVIGAGGQSTGALTNQSGRFSIDASAGTVVVVATMIGYGEARVEGVVVAGGRATNVGIAMSMAAIALNPIQVTVGKAAQKATDAPATVAVVSEEKVQERVTSGVIEHMKDVVGVDIINYGVSAGNITVRGFNNIFSGAVHFLTDNRVASIPSLQVNLTQFVPSTDEDIARMEVVLGPGSALYGPNTANGVVHLITRSPLEGSNTTVSLAGGERSVFKAVARTSQQLGENFGIKLSGSYFRGKEWEFTDPTEVAAIAQVKANPAAFAQAYGITVADANRVGQRDYDILRMGGEVRADWRFMENGTAIFQAGRSSNSGIELTGLGAGQTDDWIYSYYQARFNVGRLFAQTYLNTSDAGNSFLLKRGATLVDKSKMWVGQLQHGIALGGDRLDLIYGLDYRNTTPESEGTIYGRYEDKDEITEFGLYGQAEVKLTDMLSVIGSARFDDTSVLQDPVWSPRAALVIKPTETQTLRLTYNRAVSTPSTLNMFLDINGGRVPGAVGGLGYFVRAVGPGEDGLRFQNADGTFRGMRSPFSGNATASQPVSAQNLWNNAVNLLVARGAIPAAQAPFFRAMNMSGVGVFGVNPLTPSIQTPLAQLKVPDVPRMEASTNNTFEVGYQAVFGNRVALSADAWMSKRENFTSPLTLWTPLLFLNAAQTVPVMVAAMMNAGIPQATAVQQASAIAAGFGPAPLGVVTDPDVATLGADLFTTYVNYGELDLWGADINVTAFLTEEVTVGVTGSLVSDDYFEPVLNGVKQTVALNAPDQKGTVTLGYHGMDNGFNGELRTRFTSGFPASSADFQGTRCIGATGDLIQDCVEAATIVDLALGYQVPNTGATLQLSVSNLFDSDYRNFVGVPNIGRLALVQVKYDIND